MSSRYKKIYVTCPICKTSKYLDFPRVLFSQKKNRSIKIQIPQKAVCPDHQFIVFLDSDGVIRGYEKVDVYLAIPTNETKIEKKDELYLKELIKIFGTYGIFSLIHAKIFNYPIFIVADEDFEYNSNILNKIINQILPERYRGGRTIHLYKETYYDNIELNIEDALLLDIHQHILQIPWEQKLKFEENLVKRALEIFNVKEQIFLIEQLVSKFIKEVECFLNILETTDQISEKQLIKSVSKELMKTKISKYRLNLVIEFINRRFSPKLSSRIK
ncbi:MAG: hypothetical protein ACFFAN_03115 [Promethearchaeota archaeon]